MPEDAELLRRYVHARDEAAFAELVRRHVNLVFSAALRQTHGHRDRAEEVTQTVFIDFARKAPTLLGRTVLGGWLYLSVGHAASNLARSESRRRAREQEAHTMNEIDDVPAHDAAWQQVRPEIDAAMRELSERDREAVLLRFFEDRSFPEIGARLALSENAARMRVDRALEKLHALLARRGITSSATALALALSTQAVGAAPAGLAAAATSAALAGATTTSATVLSFLIMSKLKAAVVAGLLIAAGTVIFFQHRTNAELRMALQQSGQAYSRLSVARAASADAAKAGGDASALSAAERAELIQLREEKKNVPRYLIKNPNGPMLLQGSIMPVSNAGSGTPLAALHTLAWAMGQADVDTAVKVLHFDERGNEKLAELWARLPESTRAKFGSPEKLFANIMVTEIQAPAQVGVLGETQEGPNDVALTMALVSATGRKWNDKFNLHRTGDTWQIVAPIDAIDDYIASLGKAEKKP